jgi:hypothetical protein
MQISQKPTVKQTIAALIGGIIVASVVANVNAAGVDVTDVTVWTGAGATPNEVVTISSDPYLGYTGGVYAGINDLSVTLAGPYNGVYDGFCIDPYHFSDPYDFAASGYSIVSLTSGSAPKAPGTLNLYTATEIEDLWQEFFSPTMSAANAAGLQVAIWELVSSNAVHNFGSGDAVTFSGNTYTATADLATLAGYTGPKANLEALTGPGQDYVIDIPSYPPPGNNAPDGGVTFIMLALTLGALILARPVIMQSPGQLRRARAFLS